MSLATIKDQTPVTTTTTPTLHRPTIFIIQPYRALMYHKQAEDKIAVTGYYKTSDTSNNFNTHTTPTYHLHHPALQSSDFLITGHHNIPNSSNNYYNNHTTPTYHLHHPAPRSSDVSQAGGG